MVKLSDGASTDTHQKVTLLYPGHLQFLCPHSRECALPRSCADKERTD